MEMELVSKILAYVTKQEDLYYDKADKLYDAGKIQESLMTTQQAIGYQKVRCFIETLLDKAKTEAKVEH